MQASDPSVANAAAAASAPITTLILIRHGETTWNSLKRIQGHIDIPLSPVGEQQAALLGDAARTVLPPVQAVISSDLSRAMQTAAPVAAAFGLPVTPEPGLRERHFGQFQGHDAAAVAAQWPEAYAQWRSLDAGFTPDGGESFRALAHRVMGTLAQIARQHAGQTVVCVAHGGVLDCAYRFAAGVPLDAARACALLNASINVLEWHSGDSASAAPPAAQQRYDDFGVSDHARVIRWADIAHLHVLPVVRDEI